jgi:hypothetical protein
LDWIAAGRRANRETDRLLVFARLPGRTHRSSGW